MRGLGFAGGIAAAALTVGAIHARAPETTRAEQDARFVPQPQVARVASLGFQPLVADLYWMQAVQVVGAERVDPSRHAPLLGRLVDVVTTVDPWVSHPYRFAAHWLTDSRESVLFANRLLERGIQYHPDDWRQPFYLGFNLFYYLGDNERAAAALDHAGSLPDAPPYLNRFAARLRAHTEGLDNARVFLEELARGSEDPQARAMYEAALLEIQAEQQARALDAAVARFRERAGRAPARVDELVRGPFAVLRELPADPWGEGWKLLDDGRVAAIHLGRRYEPWIHAGDEQRRQRWQQESRQGAGATDGRGGQS